MILGIHLTLLIGQEAPTLMPFELAEALTGVEVTHSDQGRSGFQLTFQVGRAGLADLTDYGLLGNRLLRPFNRVIILITLNATPRVLMDGFITQQQFAPSSEPGQSTLSVTGEDVGVMMDLEEKTRSHTSQSEYQRVQTILNNYQRYFVLPPEIAVPTRIDVPSPDDQIPIQVGTDWNYVQELAARFNYVFYITPGPLLRQNRAYWGPRKKLGDPQSALSFNMGPDSNVESINFRYDGLAATVVSDATTDRVTNEQHPFMVFGGSLPPLSSHPALPDGQLQVRQSHLHRLQGNMTLEAARAFAEVQANESLENVVIADGELDTLRYGKFLEARSTVGVRGVGHTYDGNYYVKRVTHSIRKGEYKQRFTLARDGLGTLTPLVRS